MSALLCEGCDLFGGGAAGSSFGDDGEDVAGTGEVEDVKEPDDDVRQAHGVERIDDTDVGVFGGTDFVSFEEEHGDGDEFGVRQPFGYGAGDGEAVACSGEVVEYCFHGGDLPVFWYCIESGVSPVYIFVGWGVIDCDEGKVRSHACVSFPGPFRKVNHSKSTW